MFEETERDDVAFNEGSDARDAGKKMTDNPYRSGTLSAKSWSAGWADQDATIASEGVHCPECSSGDVSPTGEPDEDGQCEYRCGSCGNYFVDEA